ncbi:hypothetical protein [Paenibacillus sp. DCT19]|uniref:hypothetical protein n=1 Tax=Paenibacillus sp. DCT19 TaxID=2211212 RepID=UPI000FE1A56F|nr:hypothetical protein [Paenibacillus sp. DCT19]
MFERIKRLVFPEKWIMKDMFHCGHCNQVTKGQWCLSCIDKLPKGTYWDANGNPCKPTARKPPAIARKIDCIVNFNDTVKVKLTEHGVSILKAQHDELDQLIRDRSGVPLRDFQFNLDEDGYTSFSVWSLMNHFGDYMVPGVAEPFEGDMIFVGAEPIAPSKR